MKKPLVLLSLVIAFSVHVTGQTKYDTIFNYISTTPVLIDGQASEDCWTNAEWLPIGQTWIPWGANVSTDDFDGRFKVSWDAEYLYLLVEIHDDSLSDDHADPLQNWWDDDCVEIFIDEDRSLGNHERNNNAFAYHVSIFYDAIDLNSSGAGINYKDHINVVMDTIDDDLYLWEMAIKLHDASYNNSDPEASRVFPENGKIMGFSLAYCDNDETTSRENFFGTMTLTSGTANNSYIDATIFGVMKLIDPDAVGFRNYEKDQSLNLYPNPAHDFLTIESDQPGSKELELLSTNGELVYTSIYTGNSRKINVEELNPGGYILKLKEDSGTRVSKVFIF